MPTLALLPSRAVIAISGEEASTFLNGLITANVEDVDAGSPAYGALLTPREKFVLPGISRQTVIDLAREAGIPVTETDIDLYDSYTADEMFLTSTSLCICPVTRINGIEIGPEGQVWGPVTKQLAAAYSRFVDYDFVGQYLKH